MATLRSQPASERRLTPILENGDHLDRAEFERRWEAMPHLKRAELINGVVHMNAAALRSKEHGQPHGRLSTWLGHYCALTPGLEVDDASSYRIDDRNMPQPDLLLAMPERAGGCSRIDEDGYITG